MPFFILTSCVSGEVDDVASTDTTPRQISINNFEIIHDNLLFRKEAVYEHMDIRMISHISADSIGRVYIADGSQGNCRIYVFEADGTFLSTLGNNGEGPGEFLSISNLVIKQDRLYTYDNRLFRINVFSLTGLRLEKTIPLNHELWKNTSLQAPGGMVLEAVLSNGHFIVSFRANAGLSTNRVRPYYEMDSFGHIVSDKIVEKMDTPFLTHRSSDSGAVFWMEPFQGGIFSEVSSADELYVVRSDHFSIDVYTTDGELQRTLTYDYKNATLIPDEIINRFDHVWPNQNMLVQHKRKYQSIEFPDTWPALSALHLDDENRVWVALITDNPMEFRWMVVDPIHKTISTFTRPGNRILLSPDGNSKEHIRGGNFYTDEEDSQTGAKQVVRYSFSF